MLGQLDLEIAESKLDAVNFILSEDNNDNYPEILIVDDDAMNI